MVPLRMDDREVDCELRAGPPDFGIRHGKQLPWGLLPTIGTPGPPLNPGPGIEPQKAPDRVSTRPVLGFSNIFDPRHRR